ncbi:MAG: peptidoglycan editing factor PgeF [Muribaculaceae bacterium]|nr:peptidoglycan editing factor PgeF [Muribaculaceae bacterium]
MTQFIHPLLSEGRCRSFFTSRGTCDVADPYSGFSICPYTGDSSDKVSRCMADLASAIGVDEGDVFVPVQTHSSEVLVVDRLSARRPEGVDALVTAAPGLVIGVSTADCVPVVMADPVAGIVAVAHAGWRGAVAGIVEKTLLTMLGLGASVKDVRAAFGPCICAECFEVGDEVAALFPESSVRRRPVWERPHVDLAGYIRGELLKAGMAPGNISAPGPCTMHHPSRYFSARVVGVKSGRMFTFAYLK